MRPQLPPEGHPPSSYSQSFMPRRFISATRSSRIARYSSDRYSGCRLVFMEFGLKSAGTGRIQTFFAPTESMSRSCRNSVSRSRTSFQSQK